MDFAPALDSPQIATRRIFETTMGKAKEMKRAADVMLEELFRSMFEEIDTDKLRKEVDELRAGAPDFQPVQHARLLARRTAIRCAAAGAVTGLPLGFTALGTLGADLAYLVYQQFRLILGIATIYGHEPTSRERFNEAVACVAYGSGVGVSKGSIAAFPDRRRDGRGRAALRENRRALPARAAGQDGPVRRRHLRRRVELRRRLRRLAHRDPLLRDARRARPG